MMLCGMSITFSSNYQNIRRVCENDHLWKYDKQEKFGCWKYDINLKNKHLKIPSNK